MTENPQADMPEYKFYSRPGSSDASVYHQVFVEQEYKPLLDLKNVDVIIDAGAYVGYSALYFLKHFPQSTVFAIEPYTENIEVLKRNLAQVDTKRWTAYNKALWHLECPLKFERGKFRDGREWSWQVRGCDPGELPDCYGIDVLSLIDYAESLKQRVSIMKIDIEGAEVSVFQHCEKWIDQIDTIAIELHDDSIFGNATKVFHEACAGKFSITKHLDLTIARRK